MALIKCAECSKEISDQAAACPNCGAPVAVKAPPVRREPPGLSPRAKFILKLIGAGILGLIVIAAYNAPPKPPDTRTPEEKERAEICNDSSWARMSAEGTAETIITGKVATPATVKFVGTKGLYMGGCNYIVEGQFDAQNLTGALVRHRFKLTMEYLPGTKKWQYKTDQFE